MSLFTELQRIMDLEYPEEEANKKLVDTIMFVNGKLEHILKFYVPENIVLVRDYNLCCEVQKTVKTLEVYLPEAGVYPSPKGYYVIITKIPKRQWLKSFSTSFYSVDIVGGDVETNNVLTEISKVKKCNIFVTSQGYIFYWKQIIGYIQDSKTIICTNKAFKQELIDWDRNGNI
jgi:hypothetical protein